MRVQLPSYWYTLQRTGFTYVNGGLAEEKNLAGFPSSTRGSVVWMAWRDV